MDRQITIDGRTYAVRIFHKTSAPVETPRLVVVSHVPNETAKDLLTKTLRAVQHFTPEPHELWVIDNNSPEEYLSGLLQWPQVNMVLNRTEPLPPEARLSDFAGTDNPSQKAWGSYANGLALELAGHLIDPESRFLMPLHMDALPCRLGWLSYLLSKLGPNVRAAGVRLDRTRTPQGVLHVLGYVVDFQIFKKLGLDFFPDLPQLDTGDKVTVQLRRAGYQVFSCPNTVWEPELAEGISSSSPLRNLHVDRSFDDAGNVIFLHLGRGLRRTTGEHTRGTTVEEWIRTVSGLLCT
jgi:hypothetical protein